MTSRKWRVWLIPWLAAFVAACAVMMPFNGEATEGKSLWPLYEQALKGAKYVDLTHTITPNIPVWAGFADSTFAPARAGSDTEGFAKKGDVYTYEKHGFEATEYALRTDQLGTQLDPARALDAGISGDRRVACDLLRCVGRHARAVRFSLWPGWSRHN